MLTTLQKSIQNPPWVYLLNEAIVADAAYDAQKARKGKQGTEKLAKMPRICEEMKTESQMSNEGHSARSARP